MRKKSSRNSVRRIGIWAVIVACILALPYIAMAPWSVGDYIFAGGVLFTAGVAYELIARNLKNNLQRVVVGGAILFVIIFIWGWAVA